jgi:thermitase
MMRFKKQQKFLSVLFAVFSLGAAAGVSTLDWRELASAAPLELPGFDSYSFGAKKTEVQIGENQSASQNFRNWGLINSKNLSHIDAPEAWKIEKGSREIVVAVIDTGIDPHHVDLAPNIWRKGVNPAQSLAQGPSSEKNTSSNSSRTTDSTQKNPLAQKPASGSHQTPFGWDYVTNKANPFDDHGHGTHVAGIIGAVANPSSGVSGVAQEVSIMSVKYYAETNPGHINLSNTVKAIHYAIDNGAKIINYSGGGPEFSQAEYEAIKKAEARGILFIAAAGNESRNTDDAKNHYYPASYGLSNIITVAATDINNKLLSSSNWGKVRVDVAAPGENIYSTLPGNQYGYMSGTSQATAFVSGMAALILSQKPDLSHQEVIRIIKESVDTVPSLEDKIATGGKVNAHSALLALHAPAKSPRPEAVNPLASSPTISLLDAITSVPALPAGSR